MSISLPENRLLAALPADELAHLTARMVDITVKHKEFLYHTGGPMDYVYFPRGGVLSATLLMSDGATAEVAVFGREAMVGATTCLGATTSMEQVFCQVPPAECRKMPTAEFVAEFAKGGKLRDVVYHYLRSALVVSSWQTACNCLHSVEERCARWLLMCHDRMENDEFTLTHEFLSTMLGVRRATVSVTAAMLQGAGLITYRHGRVRVLNRAGLEDAACECYRAIRGAFESPMNSQGSPAQLSR